MTTWPEYPSNENPYFGDGETYGDELGRVSPEGNIYGHTRRVQVVKHQVWWDGEQYRNIEVMGQALSIEELPAGPRPLGQIWQVRFYEKNLNRYVWREYFWDSTVDEWKPMVWMWTVQGFSKLPVPGFRAGEAHIVEERDVQMMWDGYNWVRDPKHSTIYNDEPHLHLPAGMFPLFTPDARLVWVHPNELRLDAVQGGSGEVLVNNERIVIGYMGGQFVTADMPSLEWIDGQLVSTPLDVESEYYVFLANSSTAFGDRAGQLFLSRKAPENQFLCRTGVGRNARICGRVQTGPDGKFLRELNISVISNRASLPEAFREYSDYVVEFVDQDTLTLRQLDGTYGQIAVHSQLTYLGSDYDIGRTDGWIEWDDTNPDRVILHQEEISADTLYYIYLAGNQDAFNWNAVNPATSRPWQESDENAETNYSPEIDFRLRPFFSTKEPDHGRLSEQAPGYYTRHIGQVLTDGNGRFAPSRDLSAIRQPTLNPSYFDGLCEASIVAVSHSEIRIVRRKGTSGIINVAGHAVQTYESDDPRVHKITGQSPVQTYSENEPETPLTPLEPASTYVNAHLYLYVAGDRELWGDYRNGAFLSPVAPTQGYLSRNWPGNTARYLAEISLDGDGQFTGSWIVDSISAIQVLIDDEIASLSSVWSSARVNAELTKLRVQINANQAFEQEKTVGISCELVVLDNTHYALLPVTPGVVVVLPNLEIVEIPDDGYTIEIPQEHEWLGHIDFMRGGSVPLPLVAGGTSIASGSYPWRAYNGLSGGGQAVYHTVPLPVHVTIDLGYPREFVGCRISSTSTESSYSVWGFPKAVRIWGSRLASPDAANDDHWIELHQASNLVRPTSGYFTPWLVWERAGHWRHYRVTVDETQNPASPYAVYGEIEFWEAGASPLSMTANNAPAPQLAMATSENSTSNQAYHSLDDLSGSLWVSGGIPTPEAPQCWACSRGYPVAYRGVRWEFWTTNAGPLPNDVEISASNLTDPDIDNDADWTVLAAVNPVTYLIPESAHHMSQAIMWDDRTEYLWYRVKVLRALNVDSLTSLHYIEWIPRLTVCPDLWGTSTPPLVASASSTQGAYYPWHALDLHYAPTGFWLSAAKPTQTTPVRWAVDLGENNTVALARYRVHARNDNYGGYVNYRAFPSSLALSGSNAEAPSIGSDGDWTTLDVRSAITDPGAAGGTSAWFELPRGISYRHYRVSIFGSYGTYNYVAVGYFEFQSMRGSNIYLNDEGLVILPDEPDTVYPGLKTLEGDKIWLGSTL